jgi:hypothetical protein
VEIVFWVLLALHIVCWLGALVLSNPFAAVVKKGAWHAVAGALVTGVALVGVGEAADLRDFNHVKIAVKLLIAAVALVVAIIGTKKSADGEKSPLAPALAGLIVVNILIAVLW